MWYSAHNRSHYVSLDQTLHVLGTIYKCSNGTEKLITTNLRYDFRFEESVQYAVKNVRLIWNLKLIFPENRVENVILYSYLKNVLRRHIKSTYEIQYCYIVSIKII